MTKLQERLREPIKLKAVEFLNERYLSGTEEGKLVRERREAADALDSAEALGNMILLCGEPELDGLTDPASRLRALIDGLITQRSRADAAEAEIARLKDLVVGQFE